MQFDLKGGDFRCKGTEASRGRVDWSVTTGAVAVHCRLLTWYPHTTVSGHSRPPAATDTTHRGPGCQSLEQRQPTGTSQIILRAKSPKSGCHF